MAIIFICIPGPGTHRSLVLLPKEGLSQPKQGSFGFQVHAPTYMHVHIRTPMYLHAYINTKSIWTDNSDDACCGIPNLPDIPFPNSRNS